MSTYTRPVYRVRVVCGNCSFGRGRAKAVQIPQGVTVSKHRCPKCRCHELRHA